MRYGLTEKDEATGPDHTWFGARGASGDFQTEVEELMR